MSSENSERVADARDWRECAEWDWVLVGNGYRLHAIDTLDDPDGVGDTWGGEGRAACGKRGWMSIPGIFTRMSAWRCARCCDVTGMPRGEQSPKNDLACRPLAERRINQL